MVKYKANENLVLNNVMVMPSKNVIIKLTKGEILDRINGNIWDRKIQDCFMRSKS